MMFPVPISGPFQEQPKTRCARQTTKPYGHLWAQWLAISFPPRFPFNCFWRTLFGTKWCSITLGMPGEFWQVNEAKPTHWAQHSKKTTMNSVRVCHTCSRRFSFYAIKLALVRKMRVVRRPQHKGRECDAREILWHGDLCMSRIWQGMEHEFYN